MEWHGFAKFWLWFMLIVNAIVFCVYLFGIVNTGATGIFIYGAIAEAVMITAVCLLLFGKKKLGFFICCGIAVANAIVNITNGANIATVIGGLAGVGILFAAISKYWNDLA
ncbi:MAG: hypothetical protein K6G69_06185 [Lachnospiraceae bacterium]|nr:hypothetical protein [Lachnospiraceae bacterium]